VVAVLATMENTAEAVERAIRLAQEAVKSDESGDLEEAVRLYTQSVELIKLGLGMQREEEVVDNTVLHKYSKLYSDRITELKRTIEIAAAEAPTPAALGVGGATAAGSSTGFLYDDDADAIRTAAPPGAAPSGADEWRRPFWLMRILRTSMQHGSYMSPDARVFVPRRVWLQKGGRFAAMSAKLDCAQCLVAELQKVRAVPDFQQATPVGKELERFCETLDALQTSLARLLPCVPETKGNAAETSKSTMSSLTERFKGLAKTLDKTAARLGAMPSRPNDPTEYVSALVGVFDACAFLEEWIDFYIKAASSTSTGAEVLERLHRCATFFYEVVCAFVIQDLDALIQRHMRKALVGFVKGDQ